VAASAIKRLFVVIDEVVYECEVGQIVIELGQSGRFQIIILATVFQVAFFTFAGVVKTAVQLGCGGAIRSNLQMTRFTQLRFDPLEWDVTLTAIIANGGMIHHRTQQLTAVINGGQVTGTECATTGEINADTQPNGQDAGGNEGDWRENWMLSLHAFVLSQRNNPALK
jgi:hypothetical protein